MKRGKYVKLAISTSGQRISTSETTYDRFHAAKNKALSETINFDKLLANSSGERLDVKPGGKVIFDPNNPIHKKWLED